MDVTAEQGWYRMSFFLQRQARVLTVAFTATVAQLGAAALVFAVVVASTATESPFLPTLTLYALVYAPLVVLALALLGTAVYALPVLLLADRAVAARGGSTGRWRAGLAVAFGAMYALVLTFEAPADYPWAFGALVLASVLPLLAVARSDRRRAGGREPSTAGWATRFWGFALVAVLTPALSSAALTTFA
ncbi:hypothetical protein ACFWIA_22775 [Streptomyces sp. NPDC127068]|uniref:hypothetical protein n=1 Tax=Streptomyces sp. NPDC127068 TaxID=3347127 RepID=UPI003654048F